MRRFREPLGIPVNVTIEIHDAITGRLLRREKQHNLVVLAGRNLVRDAINGAGGSYTLTHFAVGTGTAAPASTDTALGAEVWRDVVTKRTPDAGKLTIHYYLSSTAANGNALTEAGLFNAASGGTMFARVKYSAINKTASISVTYAWEININAG